MKTYARIEDSVVAELFQTTGDITKMFHPDLVWIDTTDIDPGPQIGWTYDGTSFSEPVVIAPEPTVPYSVTRRQARLALIDAGKLADVEAAIAAIIGPAEKMKAEVEYEADTWERGNAFLQAMWAQLGGTDAQLDDLFILASTK